MEMSCEVSVNYGDGVYEDSTSFSYEYDEDAAATGNGLGNLLSSPAGWVVLIVFGSVLVLGLLILIGIAIKIFA
jgi:hypothetical protein